MAAGAVSTADADAAAAGTGIHISVSKCFMDQIQPKAGSDSTKSMTSGSVQLPLGIAMGS